MASRIITSIIATTISVSCAMAKTVQESNANSYYELGWQLSIPLKTTNSGGVNELGLFFNAGRNISPNLSIGGFVNYSRREDDYKSTTNTCDFYRQSLMTVPFGASARYCVAINNHLKPYIGANLGANYAHTNTMWRHKSVGNNSFGFYIEPEIGMRINPFKNTRFGFSVSLSYSYATNRLHNIGDTVTGISNLNLKIGLVY